MILAIKCWTRPRPRSTSSKQLEDVVFNARPRPRHSASSATTMTNTGGGPRADRTVHRCLQGIGKGYRVVCFQRCNVGMVLRQTVSKVAGMLQSCVFPGESGFCPRMLSAVLGELLGVTKSGHHKHVKVCPRMKVVAPQPVSSLHL